MKIKDKAYIVLQKLGGRATEAQLVKEYIKIYPDYDKNYTPTKTSPEAKIRGTINVELMRNSLHKKIKVDKTKEPYEYYIVDFEERLIDENSADIELQKKFNDINSSEPESKPQPIKSPKENNNVKVYPRNLTYAKKALEEAKFLCEVDNTHESFISKATNQLYVEAHHLIPLEFQEKFSYSLDVPANIVSLCPNCHRKLHFAFIKDKNEILEKLLMDRYDKLKEFGIEISKDELFEIYI